MKDKAKLVKIFEDNKGYASRKELLSEGVHTRDIKHFIDEDVIERIRPGLYRLKSYPFSEIVNFSDICKSIPKGVICLHSALSYYELTTFVPVYIMLAVPLRYKSIKLDYPAHKIFYFSKSTYETEIKEMENGLFRVYSKEKSIVDAFRYRNKLGLDIAKESLNEYLKTKDKNISKLLKVARTCRVYKTIMPYLEAMT